MESFGENIKTSNDKSQFVEQTKVRTSRYCVLNMELNCLHCKSGYPLKAKGVTNEGHVFNYYLSYVRLLCYLFGLINF